MTPLMISSAIVTQNACADSRRCTRECSRLSAMPLIVAVASSGMDRTGDQTGDLLGTGFGDRLFRHLAAAAQHQHPVGDREYVWHAMADQDDGDALVTQPADQIEHLGNLAHRDR